MLTLPIEQSWPVQLGSQLQSPVSGRKVPCPEHWSRQVALGVSQFVPPQPTEQWHSPRTHTPRPEQVGSMQSTVRRRRKHTEKANGNFRKKAYQTAVYTNIFTQYLKVSTKKPCCEQNRCFVQEVSGPKRQWDLKPLCEKQKKNLAMKSILLCRSALISDLSGRNRLILIKNRIRIIFYRTHSVSSFILLE